MCRMIAKVSVNETSIIEEMEHCPVSLYYLSQQGMQSSGERGKHDDGCGIAFAQNEKIVVEKRGKENFWDESYTEVISKAQSKIFIAHNRFTSTGLNSNINGAHPFIGELNNLPVAFCHNGTAHSYIEEAKARDTSDTKIFLEKIISCAKDLSDEEIAKSVSSIASGISFNSLCAFLITPEKIFAWRIFDAANKEEYERRNKYYTLYLCMRKNSVVLSSEPLDDEPWWLLPNKTFLSVTPKKESVQVNYRTLNFRL